MPVNKVVVRYADGRLVKGTTADFFPNKQFFHVAEAGAGEPLEIWVRELKALFFVKDLVGDPEHRTVNEFDASKPVVGVRKIKVVFNDGETMVGTTSGYHPDRIGFFVEPADSDDNNERVFVVAAATREVSFV